MNDVLFTVDVTVIDFISRCLCLAGMILCIIFYFVRAKIQHEQEKKWWKEYFDEHLSNDKETEE